MEIAVFSSVPSGSYRAQVPYCTVRWLSLAQVLNSVDTDDKFQIYEHTENSRFRIPRL